MSKQDILIIEPKNRISGTLSELWAYRELFFFLAWRDFIVRYKQTIVGNLFNFLNERIDRSGAKVIASQEPAATGEAIEPASA